jgi:alpha-amylase/alpha-mannosidase (GH57 family)
MSGLRRSVVIHAHFYQPPREDPWLGEIAREESAAPFHDWNERILHECYRAVVSARVPDAQGRIIDVVNTLDWVSFNVGPTLAEWLEQASPETYATFLEADARSAARSDGHGNAIAMPYHHTILPLATRRDKVTEVRWGIEDFRRRFGREPAGMWLPETAVDDATLDVLAEYGIRFTILAPHQVRVPPAGGWPGLYRTRAGRSIAVFCYNGERAHDVAFGPALRDAANWERRLAEDGGELITIATDGETFGHHHTFGEMALASLVRRLEASPSLRLENCASILERHPPTAELDLVEDTSWSCVHGVERWRSACGCRMHPERATHQEWRAVLRHSLDWLAGELHAVYRREAGRVVADPWALRDEFGWAVTRGDAAMAALVRERTPTATVEERVRLAELLELEHNALRMFTSCGWFFDDIGGLESRQVLRYAARAIELTEDQAPRLEAGLRERLSHARSNDQRLATGSAIYVQGKPAHPTPVVAAACGTFADLFRVERKDTVPPSFSVESGTSFEEPCMTVMHVGTGRRWCLPVAVAGSRIGEIVVTVTDRQLDASHTLRFPDLPESARRAIARSVSREIVSRRFEERDHDALGSGEPLATVAGDALQRAIGLLDGDGSARPETVSHVLDLLDLLDVLGHSVPYDARTTFFHVLRHRDAQADDLRPVARRLGFA